LAYQMAGNAIGFGTARVAAPLNPERIIIVGPSTRSFDLMEPSMAAAIEDGVTPELRQNLKVEVMTPDLDLIVQARLMRRYDVSILRSLPLVRRMIAPLPVESTNDP
jgi:hypothetical protein